MGSPSLYSARKTTLALAVALSFAWQAPVFAHGGEAHMVPMDKTLKEFGADVQWDDYAQLFTLIKDGAYVKVKPGAQTAIVNGQPLALQVPVVMKDNKAWVSDTFINDVFQSGLDQTFQVEKRPHPLNALTADEIKQAVELRSPCYRQIKKLSGRLRWKTNRLTSRAKPTSLCSTANISSKRWWICKTTNCSPGNPLKTPTVWCCWMISPVCRTLLTTVKNLPLP